MLEAKIPQLETEGISIHDSELNCHLRFFRVCDSCSEE